MKYPIGSVIRLGGDCHLYVVNVDEAANECYLVYNTRHSDVMWHTEEELDTLSIWSVQYENNDSST